MRAHVGEVDEGHIEENETRGGPSRPFVIALESIEVGEGVLVD